MQWPDQIHANDSILTFGYSETVLVFLLEAAKKLDFQACSSSHGKNAIVPAPHPMHWRCLTVERLIWHVNVT